MSVIPSRRELLAWALAVVLALTTVVLARPDRAGAGVDPEPSTEVVYVATGENFPDALAAAATAALGLGPVLLVQQNAIPTPTLNELNRLQPTRIVIVGGTAVISSGVQSQLEGLAFSPEVTRVAGANRYATAAELSQAHFPTSGLYPRAAHAETHDLPDGGPFPQTLLTVDIEAPAPGVLLMAAGADHSGPFLTGAFDCRLQVNGATVVGSVRHVQHGDGNHEEDCTTEAAIDVAAGTHTVEFRGTTPDGTGTLSGSLWVLWVPFDGTGAVPTP